MAEEIWNKIVNDITQEPFFGIAVDAGIDKVLSEHVLVGVLYVAQSDYLLPPMYHPRRKAFNGKESAEILVETLSSIIGVHLLGKLRYMMVDGCAVNHVARDEAEEETKRIFDRIRPIGENNWGDFNNAILNKLPSVALLSCIGHFLNNVARDSMKKIRKHASV